MPLRQFSLAEITIATNNFDEANLLGAGGEGKVFKGQIQIDGVDATVAVKFLKSMKSSDRFHDEIEIVSRFYHTNLLSLIGYCEESNHKILVYEYAQKGSLANYLYGCHRFLDWDNLVNISIDAARGLNFLHQRKIIHRDVKPGNILLDENWGAKISDFGLLKRGLPPKPQESSDPINTGLKGTFGYYDPAYVFKNQVTTKTDVYSFGVVMLEILCRKKREWPLHDESSSRGSTEEEEEIATWARKNIAPYLKSQISDECLEKFIDIARACLLRDPKQRPSMANVVSMLEVAQKLQNQKGSKYEAYRTEHSHCSEYEALPTGHSHCSEYEALPTGHSQTVF